MEPLIIKVRIAEFKIARPPALLKSYGLGSCVGVALFDPEARIGGMAHILLPNSPRSKGRASPALPKNPLKYVDLALDQLRRQIIEQGGVAERLEAKIAGGANMFSTLLAPSSPGPVKPSIGERNVQAVRDKLKRLGIPLRAEDVGGAEGRTLELNTGTGALRVTTTRGLSRVL